MDYRVRQHDDAIQGRQELQLKQAARIKINEAELPATSALEKL
jgi:hypothetical protein